MPKKIEKQISHPDDFMVVRIGLELRARSNPNVENPAGLETIMHERVLGAARAADYVERVLGAIRDRRLYGLMMQLAAESSVGASEWVAMEVHDSIAEIHAHRSEDGSSDNPGAED
jgi:hypothetical protein